MEPYRLGDEERKIADIDEFLYKEGLLGGCYSDITLKAFDKEYKLHRLMLVRSPFFQHLIGERWNTEDNRVFEVNLTHDGNMTKEAFELTLKYIYGKQLTSSEAEDHLFGLLALSSYFDLPKLIDFATIEIVDRIGKKEVEPIAIFCHEYDYGSTTARIKERCLTFLEENLYSKCYRNREVTMAEFVGYPVKLMTTALSSERLYVPTEWTRCLLFVAYYEAMIPDKDDEDEGADDVSFEKDKLQVIQEALNNGVYFCNIEFGQLRRLMKTKKSIDGKPLIYEETALKHVWMSAELEYSIENTDREEAGLLSSEPDHPYNVPNTLLKGLVPPIRFSAEFINDGPSSAELRTKPIFYGGSYWWLSVSTDASRPLQLHRCSHLSEGYSFKKTGKVSLLPDGPNRFAAMDDFTEKDTEVFEGGYLDSRNISTISCKRYIRNYREKPYSNQMTLDMEKDSKERLGVYFHNFLGIHVTITLALH